MEEKGKRFEYPEYPDEFAEKNLVCSAVVNLLNTGETDIAIASALAAYYPQNASDAFFIICDWALRNGMIDLVIKLQENLDFKITEAGAEAAFGQCLALQDFEKALLALPLFPKEKQGEKQQLLLNRVLDQEKFELGKKVASGLDERLLHESLQIQFDFLLEQKKFCQAGELLSLASQKQRSECWPELLDHLKKGHRVIEYLRICASLKKKTNDRTLSSLLRGARKKGDINAAIIAAKAMKGRAKHFFLLELMEDTLSEDSIEQARDLARTINSGYFGEGFSAVIKKPRIAKNELTALQANASGQLLN